MVSEVQEWIARAFVSHRLVQTGGLEPVKERPWATVLRAATSGGDVYFKANAPGGRHEPALVSELARDWPDFVPAPLATDVERGWMLTLDHGPRMRDALDPAELLAAWELLLPRYAELQLASAREPERWLRLGVPDRRLDRLPARTEELIRRNADLDGAERAGMLALIPELRARCGELSAALGMDALEHGDLHDTNVLVSRGRRWLFDWADASVSYPFCSLFITCSMATDDLESATGRRTSARLCDAYLEPWTALAPATVVRSLLPIAFWIANAGRALDWDHMLEGASGAGLAEWQPRVADWLRRWADRRGWAARATWP